ncbi:hypothetical protein HYV49_01085 [Candidatus Pacearchaeota archaeon]|nr:hypothetical protein [Candidatus Pacearchaeota archaeon]
MKKVLMYKGKYENLFYDVSTEELKSESFLKLFNFLDRDVIAYVNLTSDEKEPICSFCNNSGKVSSTNCGITRQLDCPDCGGNIKRDRQYYKNNVKPEREYYNKAKTGDADAAIRLLNHRKKYQYEEWEIYDIQ